MNVFMVHGCPSTKEEDPETRTYDKHWIPWIKRNLEVKNILVELVLMPEPWNPSYESWKKEFDKFDVNEDSVLIGHSCGCAFLVRWLGEVKKKIKKLILVAQWKIPSKEYSGGENEMYHYEIEENIKDNVEKVVIFTSDNEDLDGKKSAKIFQEILGGDIIELKDKGHFCFRDMGTEEFPELLQNILE